jgi:hypothetical protein
MLGQSSIECSTLWISLSLALLADIRLGIENTSAYSAVTLVTKEKSFIPYAIVSRVTKLFCSSQMLWQNKLKRPSNFSG